ncbi:MAG TPA: protein-glutamine glutaminase family protein [Candidatus Acidoferrum sp.]|nr:protein-glutamine glutaminase family protein [Candidatus Acidoferrum sp.]
MATSRETSILTLAAIRKVRGETQYLFNEKEAIFALSGGKAARAAGALLKEALRKKLPVKAEIDTREGAIHRVSEASEREIDEFKRLHIPLEKPEKTQRVSVSLLDPTFFNIERYHRRVRCFRHCRRIIPSYKKAKDIFDFCARQTCSLGGPFQITPCIPFQYVIDGCYARAHKMRWVITTKYHYCCEKVFSFANQGSDTLAVQATKWGGCCVFWWYHVAPLVRVRLGRIATLLMVIDPGMFDKPVLLTTWLAAQENKTCSANAHVSMYSIQPGTAYSPANFAGTAFTTDPNYTQTNATLIAYRNLVTC